MPDPAFSAGFSLGFALLPFNEEPPESDGSFSTGFSSGFHVGNISQQRSFSASFSNGFD
jgi:hypothetical protein